VVEWLNIRVKSQVQISAWRPAILTKVFVVFLSSSSECRDSTLNYATIASFHILSNLSSIYYTFIGRYILEVPENASLNMLQINK
jgi:hypothetical protein